MPRPSLGKTRIMTSLPPDLLQEVEAIAADTHQTRADAIQEAVEVYVKKYRPKKAEPAPSKR